MRIALDATPLIEPAGGVRRYLVELVRALASSYPGDEFHLLTDARNWIAEPDLSDYPNVLATPPGGPAFFGKWWSMALPWELRRRGIDIFHGTDFAVPYAGGTPRVLTLHDLSPWKPESLRPPGSERVRRRGPGHVRRARLVITPSEAVRQEAIRFFGIDAEKVVAIPHGVSDRFARVDETNVTNTLQNYAITRPYLLHVGALHSRKNFAGLLAAWRLVKRRKPDLALVLAGASPASTAAEAADIGLRFLPAAPDAAVAALLSAAAAFVYPTLYEGFGLSALEAMKAGAPVVTSMDEAIRETCGDAAIRVDANSPEKLSQAILQILDDSDFAERMRMKGFERAERFTWRTAAMRTRGVYERAIRSG